MPHQLPAPVRRFVGRDEQLAALNEVLDSVAGSPGPAIAAITGTAGIGKCTLALHWAHEMTDRFPDGQLYVNLRGYDPGGPPLEPAAAIRGFLDGLGLPDERVPRDPREALAATGVELLTPKAAAAR